MTLSGNYKINKIEKGPLQRFKNQNLLLKKFGEAGLELYKAITGKRTTDELQKDLEMDLATFSKILEYMQEAGMVELTPAGAAEEAPKAMVSEEKPAPSPEAPPREEKEEAITFEEIKPVEEAEEKKKEKAEPLKPAPPEEEFIPPSEEEKPPEELRYEEVKPPEPEEEKKKRPVGGIEEELAPAPEPFEPEQAAPPPEEELTPVERIVKEKYGEVGLKVYVLIDGRRTAEQIMKETGLTEAKLVEILDFMDEQGIIKLEYPREKRGVEAAMPTTIEREEFAPMLAKEEEEEKLKAGIELPAKAGVDFVRGMQLKTTIMFKLGDKGGKMFELINGKRDIIDLALGVPLPLYEVDRMLKFLMQQRAIVFQALTREEVKKKYGDDGYAVFKRYGKEGLMLYELIGKEMTIRQMAEMVSTDKEKVVEMFLFIHKVLGIDLPIDKEVLYKQLGVG